MRVLTHVPEEFVAPFRDEFPEVAFVPVPTEGPVPSRLVGDALYTWTRGAHNLADVLRSANVPWIHSLTAGVDGFPLELVGDRVLTCARGAAAHPIGEWAITVMLAFEKHLPEQWIVEPPDTWLFGALGSLRERHVGLIGFGSIGREIARHARWFGAEVSAVRRTARPSPTDDVTLVGTLDELLPACDHLVVAAPATPQTHHLLDGPAFAKMRRGVHLVNIARGSLIDQEALRDALDAGVVARATLDTTTPEPLPAGHWMYTHEGVRLTPHVSWSAPGALDRTIRVFAANLRRRIDGQPLEGVVDVKAGY